MAARASIQIVVARRNQWELAVAVDAGEIADADADAEGDAGECAGIVAVTGVTAAVGIGDAAVATTLAAAASSNVVRNAKTTGLAAA